MPPKMTWDEAVKTLNEVRARVRRRELSALDRVWVRPFAFVERGMLVVASPSDLWRPFCQRVDVDHAEFLHNFPVDKAVPLDAITDPQLRTWQDSARPYYRTIDGIPWEMHGIEDPVIRAEALKAFHTNMLASGDVRSSPKEASERCS